MFETILAIKHTPQDGTRIHIACYLFTVQVMNAPSVSVPHTYAHSVTCDDGPSSTSDADLLYASLIPGTLLYSSDSEGENVSVAEDDPQVFQRKTSWSLQEILEQLAVKINEDKISKFNISRSHLWEGALRGLRRKSFSPDNKVY